MRFTSSVLSKSASMAGNNAAIFHLMHPVVATISTLSRLILFLSSSKNSAADREVQLLPVN
jgi:hypothetical protein